MYYSYLFLEILGAMAVSTAITLVTQLILAFLDGMQERDGGGEERGTLVPDLVKRVCVSREARKIWIKRVVSPGIG